MNRSNTFKNIEDILPSMMANPSGGRKKVNRSRQGWFDQLIAEGSLAFGPRTTQGICPRVWESCGCCPVFSFFSPDFPVISHDMNVLQNASNPLEKTCQEKPISLSRISDSPSPTGWGSLGSTKRAGRTRSSHATGSSASGGNRSLLEPPQKMDKMMNMMKTAWL